MASKIQLLRKIVLFLILVWSAIIVSILFTLINENYNYADRLAKQEAITSVDKDLAYRSWVSSHGGVYVPITEKTPPNPYLAHIKNRDTLISTVAVVLAGAIAYLAMMARWAMIFGRNDNNSGNLYEVLALSIVAPIVATILRLSISRSREYLADETGAKIIKDPTALASALKKIENYPHKLKKGNQAVASLFIINPFSTKYFFKLFSTHPPTHERVKKLRKLSMSIQ